MHYLILFLLTRGRSRQSSWRGRGGSERSPPAATTDSVVGDALNEGGQAAKEAGSPPATEGDSSEVPPNTSTDIPEGVPIAMPKGLEDKEDPTCGEKN
ncbi:UNVERIFIED_CONTAM: hypothetical protein Slati_3724300 [Sesamum latifolium]|uniref:Uncharacterized protein n=1 Tax=Sesamum latifolium TaxID=2727402 RepID=A0AAW2U6F7_9LAMI